MSVGIIDWFTGEDGEHGKEVRDQIKGENLIRTYNLDKNDYYGAFGADFIDVYNLSLGHYLESDKTVTEAIEYLNGTNKIWNQIEEDNESVFVFAAGNDGTNGFEVDGVNVRAAEIWWTEHLSDQLLVVGELQDNGVFLENHSNRAGIFANNFVCTTEESENEGTSLATPKVADLADDLIRNYELTPEQAVQVILETCDDLGAKGVDAVYGHGRVNYEEAMDLQNVVEIVGIHNMDMFSDYISTYQM